MKTTVMIGDTPVVVNPRVPPGMLIVMQGEVMTGAIANGVVFGVEEIRRMQREVAKQMRAQG